MKSINYYITRAENRKKKRPQKAPKKERLKILELLTPYPKSQEIKESQMYVSKQIRSGDYILIRKYTPRLFGAPLKKRIKRLKETPGAMRRYNTQRKAEKLQMLILNNFDKGFSICLDYPRGQRPETYEEAERNLTKCLNKVSRRLKKKGIEFKYIAITERGRKAAALHHHIIIEGFSEVLEELMSAWGQHMKISAMYEEGAYKDLAEYFCKLETKEENSKGKSKYHRSRNLKEPDERRAVVEGKIKDKPWIPEGYRLIEGSYKNGFNEIIGIRYQSYMIKKERQKVNTKGADGEAKRNRKKTVFELLRRFFGGKT